MGIISHAQNFEDVILWRALGHVDKGQYLDIGAQDPCHDSISLAFYERGWRGVHVEPTPSYAKLLREARPDEIVIEAAVCTSPGPIDFFQIDSTGLSTGDAAIAKEHEKRGFFAHRIVVPTVRLESLLDRFEELHWLKIDVEGMEDVVLDSWGTHPLRPWIVVVEATKPMEREASDLSWRQHLFERDYEEVYFDGLNRFFVHAHHAGLSAFFDAPPSVFDEFGLSDTHFAAKSFSGQIGGLADALAASEASRADIEASLQAKQEELDHAHHVASEYRSAASEYRSDALARAEELARETAKFAARIDTLSAERAEIEREFARQAAATADYHAADRERRRLEHEAREAELSDALSKSVTERGLLEQRLSLAHGTVRAILTTSSSRGALLARFLGLIKDDPIKARLEAALPLFDGNQPNVSESHMSPPLNTNRNPYLRANSLAELLAWDDVDFVRCAYVTILGRQPDAGGEIHYTEKLRGGSPKMKILSQLRSSHEALRHDPGIAGLDRALKSARWSRTIFGRTVLLFLGSEGYEPTSASSRLLLNEMRRSRLETMHRHDLLQKSISELQGKVGDLGSSRAQKSEFRKDGQFRNMKRSDDKRWNSEEFLALNGNAKRFFTKMVMG